MSDKKCDLGHDKSRDKVTRAMKDSSMFLYLYPDEYWGWIRESSIWS